MRPAEAEAPVPAAQPRWVMRGGWSGRLVVALAVYVALAATCMLSGFGGEAVARYIGLVADLPANLIALYLTAIAARRAEVRGVRFAWWSLAAALALYLVGSITATSYWMFDRDPFPGPADLFFLAFYGPLFAAVLALTRAAAVRVPWARLTLDGTIFVAGFGACFWYLVIRPATQAAELDVVKQVLSQTYVALNCLLLLAFGVLLLAGGGTIRRRVPLLLTAGYAMMCIGDILWSLGKVAGDYLPGGLQDVMYVACYLPLAAAAREQLRGRTDAAGAGADGNTLVPGLPYAAMFVSLLVLVYFGRGDVSDPATIMTIVVFGLLLLLLLRQGLVMRDEALLREQRATSLVEARYASLIANASDVIMIASADGALRFASPAAQRTFGVAPSVMEHGNLLDLWHGEPRARAAEFLAQVAASRGPPVGPVELQFDRGDERCTLEAVGSNLADDPAVRALALNFRDITERKTLEEQLRRLAFHDPLTLLANRNLFRDRVQHALVLAQRAGHCIAVLFLDLDDFKIVNDTLGHDSGDRLLQAAAQRLLKCTRSSDTVARLGGDEFAILLEGVDAAADTEPVAARVIDSLREPFTLGGSEVRVAASLGLAYSTATEGAEELLRDADIAMYNAKARGKGRYVIFQPQMQEVLRERLRMEEDIGRALSTGEFFLEYQPIVDLGSRSLLGIEALVRWRHPDRGVVMPGQFIQVAEESGQIVALGRWVLLEACRSVRAWRDSIAGGAGLRVAVNISGRHLQHADLVGDVAAVLRETGLEPGSLVIELTESTIMNNTDANLERLHQLKALGVRLAIDDFGTGYSSLSYLHRFPIDILKIDRSFVSRLVSDDDGPELARAVVRLGETLGLDTVAEGVEDESQVAALLDLGCVAAQGFLFSASTSLETLSASRFAARRRALWEATCSAPSSLSATGRFPALIAAGRG